MDMSEEYAKTQFVVNMECHFWLIREFLPGMLEKGKGHVVSIASMAGCAGQPMLTDYCASKFGAVGLMEGLRIEMKREKKNVACTTICPFFINTGMFEGTEASLIFPFLNQGYVVNRIVNAILQEENEVSISWLMGVAVHTCKGLFPSCVNDLVVWGTLGWDTMANFKGRQEKNAIHQTKVSHK